MKTLTLLASGALALVAASGVSLAQPAPPAANPFGPPARGPAMALAVEGAQTAIAACAANGYKVSAVIVDSVGAPRVVLSSDGAPTVTIDLASRKAYTANAFKMSSGAAGEKAKTDQGMAGRMTLDTRMIPWAGGKPLMVGADTIGAMAVSGAPGGDKDEACLDVGLAKIKDRLK